jgi:hypothetical protein
MLMTRSSGGVVTPHSTIRSFAEAFHARGETPLRADGQPMAVTSFGGGELFDNLPLNVYVYGVWYSGQQEALQGSWDAGSIPQPAPSVLALPVVPPIDETAQAANSELLTYAAVGLLAYFLLKR